MKRVRFLTAFASDGGNVSGIALGDRKMTPDKKAAMAKFLSRLRHTIKKLFVLGKIISMCISVE